MVDWDSARSGSRLLGGVTGFRRRLAAAAGESLILRRLDAVQSALDRAATNSSVGAGGRTVGRWTRGSWLYRWLTKEPDPDVIVIDLRETWTVGPVIAGLDWLAGGAGKLVQRSGLGEMGRGVEQAFRTAPVQIMGIVAFVAVLVNTVAITALGGLDDAGLGVRLVLLAMATLATRVETSWDELREGRVGRFVSAIFEPPPVPEADDEVTTAAESSNAEVDREDVEDEPEVEGGPTIEDVATLENRDDR
ncbi:hypothetical protein [Halorientalis salina]|uniref:hypothetical protein n=1 Tax=Halorientalis salina TaxID=2932266 RepID=UPI0010ACF30A|nr:hypothetical protein [Halorientalis salina]